jgi:DNA polymerase I
MAQDIRPVKPGDHVFLVDGSSYIFRAYHALPPLTRKSDGLPVGAIAGFCNMLWKLLRDADGGVKPTHLAVVFDKSEQTFRKDIYPQYKAHRPDPPDDLIPQFAFIRHAVARLLAGLPGAGRLRGRRPHRHLCHARRSRRARTCASSSSDKDLMQLVVDDVVMHATTP